MVFVSAHSIFWSHLYVYIQNICVRVYIYICFKNMCVRVCVCACCHRRLCSLDRNTRLFVLMDGYVGFSPKYLRSFPRNIHSEFSLENAQMEKCQEWCNCACLAKNTPNACFPQFRIYVLCRGCPMIYKWYAHEIHTCISLSLSLSLSLSRSVFVCFP